MYTGTLIEFLNMGGGEIMLILAVVLLLFGGKKLPELARGLGKGIRDFKDASEGVKREIHRNINSVGIVDDIKSIADDHNTGYNNPYDYKADEPSHLNTESETATEPVNFDKQEAVAHHESDYNSKIETDKTKL